MTELGLSIELLRECNEVLVKGSFLNFIFNLECLSSLVLDLNCGCSLIGFGGEIFLLGLSFDLEPAKAFF